MATPMQKTLAEEKLVAARNEAFLKDYPQYFETYSYGILTKRIQRPVELGDVFEHYRLAEDLRS